jgi:tetratricopeptide (TPR) repeat protein
MTQQIYSKLHPVFYILLLPFLFASCGLFDKDIKQDQHITAFKHQMNRVTDSLDTPAERIKALKTIMRNIEKDGDLITLRKKNKLLIEGDLHISNEYFNVENYPKAIEYTNMAIQLDSLDAGGYFNRGSIYQSISEDSLARVDYTRAISLNNSYTDAYYNRGIIYEKAGEYKKALDDYNKAIKHQPANITNIYNNRGNIYLALKDTSKALSDYTKVLDIDTTNIIAYTNRIGIYIKQKEFDKALADCNKALTLDSMYVRLYYQRAVAYEQMKKYEQAIDDYEQVLLLDKRDRYKTREKVTGTIKRLQPLAKSPSIKVATAPNSSR